jgi:hypothetical protein
LKPEYARVSLELQQREQHHKPGDDQPSIR